MKRLVTRLLRGVYGASNNLLNRYLGLSEDFLVFLGTNMQRTSMFAALNTNRLWKQEPLARKLRSLLTRQWSLPDEAVQIAARKCFADEVFGTESDYGDALFRLMGWHHSRDWELDALTPGDSARASAIEAMTVLTRTRFRGVSSEPRLNLELARRAPAMCMLVHPMVAKIPVVSMRYFLDVHSTFAFNSIRRSGHTHADDLVAYLYDTLFLQQKIAVSLHEYLRLAAFAQQQKNEAQLINAEIDAIIGADTVFTYLKASIEKTIVLVGLTHGIANLDLKKTHRAKMNALTTRLPDEVTELPYCQFVLDFISSENLDELNSYRSGLLHKKGIADLQPHNYVGVGARSLPLRPVFAVLHEQHAKNTAVLLGALALLTDELVRRDPPDMRVEDIPMQGVPPITY